MQEQYLSVVKEPMSVSELKAKLNAKMCKYTLLYEAFHDLCLIAHNCRVFNSGNEYLIKETTLFEETVLQCVNQFLFKVKARPVSSYQEISGPSLLPLEATPATGPEQTEVHQTE